jgi:hypothetical protein
VQNNSNIHAISLDSGCAVMLSTPFLNLYLFPVPSRSQYGTVTHGTRRTGRYISVVYRLQVQLTKIEFESTKQKTISGPSISESLNNEYCPSDCMIRVQCSPSNSVCLV